MERFLPTITSPKQFSQKNLTGIRRTLKDLTAEFHACIHQWNSIHLYGISILKSITSIKNNDSYPRGLQDLCNELEKNVDRLDTIVINLEVIVSQIKAVASLHKGREKFFITWPPQRFIELADQICDAYQNEAIIKRQIFHNVAHDCSDSWKMLHLASWTHQPMIPHKLDSNIEALLNETGYR